ncbi:MAG: PQQ-binding-like beta-propeller repeat protein [Alphaproteobacteria bacterium]|nr:PQQ-binding-like beta-propeller repeat protein [Alphaproteobacteria bacterium]
MKISVKRDLAFWGAVLLLSACSSSSDDRAVSTAPADQRIAVLAASHQRPLENRVTGFQLSLPEPALADNWPQTGGNTRHAPGHPALATSLKKVWQADIGKGSGGYYKLLASPVVRGGVIYSMDSRGEVSAFSTDSGKRLWRAETAPKKRATDTIGGGIALEGEFLYATTGFGEVVSMSLADGSVLWRQSLGKPLRAAPTVAEGRVFVISIENETYALEAQTGRILWDHAGIAESATLMGASSPAVEGDTVVVAYSSGELFGLRAQNGRVVWSDVLAAPARIGALPAIADIRGLPVIEGRYVYATSHSGRTSALGLNTGARAWEVDLGGMNTPSVVGNGVFLVTLDNELVALCRDTGRVAWVSELQKREKPKKKDSKAVSWWGPVLAGGQLWLTNSMGHLASFDPQSGDQLSTLELGNAFFLPPVITGGVLYALDDSGKLYALR